MKKIQFLLPYWSNVVDIGSYFFVHLLKCLLLYMYSFSSPFFTANTIIKFVLDHPVLPKHLHRILPKFCIPRSIKPKEKPLKTFANSSPPQKHFLIIHFSALQNYIHCKQSFHIQIIFNSQSQSNSTSIYIPEKFVEFSSTRPKKKPVQIRWKSSIKTGINGSIN